MNNTIERVLHTLSKWGLVVEHKKNYTRVIHQGDIKTAPDIASKRFIFAVSYAIHQVVSVSEYWFETKRGKKIFVMWENSHTENRISYRAELKSFFCHFSHRHKQWVHHQAPKVILYQKNSPMNENMDFRYHTCDFSKCRYAFEMSIALDLNPTTAEEVISESYRVLGNSLRSRVTEINEILTGVKNDGNLTSPLGCPLADNLVCRECGYPVFAVPTSAYIYDCIHHGEIDYPRVDKVDPKTYEEILANCMTAIEHYCECPQD